MAKISSKNKIRRTTSNIFGSFSQNQLAEFKQAFQFIDFNKDGIIDKTDITAAFDSLGRAYPAKDIEEMVQEGGGKINFAVFIKLIGEKINDDEDSGEDLSWALKQFDLKENGKMNRDVLFRLLNTFGDRFSDEELNTVAELVPVDSNNEIDLVHLCKLIKGNLDED